MKNSKKYNKILISGYYGFDNFGDESILQTLVTKLKTQNNKITVLSSNPQKTSEYYDVSSVYSFDMFKVFANILKCDTFISGGGSLLQDTTSFKSLAYYLILLNLALFFGKKVVIFAQGLGPFRNKLGALWVKHTLKRCSYISVRDKKSQFLLKKWGINSELVCDPFFDIPLPTPQPQGIVGIQLRKTKTLNINYLKELARFVAQNFKDKKLELYSFQESLDLKICEQFREFLNENGADAQIISQKTPYEMIERISKLDYMIAMRFHAVLTSVRLGIRTLAVSYDMKVEKIAREFNIPCLQMKSSDDFTEAFQRLRGVDSKSLVKLSEEKSFNWDKVLTQ
ncbi:polysaccharide pyruvyl transferase CsaB [bacterium]|nr:polysaccharide pyruvyl transferase CsaB [bacterium]